MNCMTGWGRKFLLHHFSKSWLDGPGEDGYRSARKITMLERERGEIQKTLVRIKEVLVPARERRIALNEKKALLARTALKIAALDLVLQEITLAAVMLPLGVAPESKKKEQSHMEERSALVNEKTTIQSQIDKSVRFTRASDKKVKLIRFCPSNECRGMIDDEGLCVICKTEVCLLCHSEKLIGETHECNKDDVKSVEALSDQSKPCPSCGTLISKISGCDQMWCPTCKGTFSWAKGEITHEKVHNPHAVQWMRENSELARDPLDVPCGGFTAVRASEKMVSPLRAALQGSRFWENAVSERENISCSLLTVQSFLELFYGLDETVEKLGETVDGREVQLSDSRTSFCLGHITEEEWKSDIFGIIKNSEYAESTRNILISLRNLSVGRFNILAGLGDPHQGLRGVLDALNIQRTMEGVEVDRTVDIGDIFNRMNFGEIVEDLVGEIDTQEVEGVDHRQVLEGIDFQGLLGGFFTTMNEMRLTRDARGDGEALVRAEAGRDVGEARGGGQTGVEARVRRGGGGMGVGRGRGGMGVGRGRGGMGVGRGRGGMGVGRGGRHRMGVGRAARGADRGNTSGVGRDYVDGVDNATYIVKVTTELLALLSLACDALREDAEESEMENVPGITVSVEWDNSVDKHVLIMKWFSKHDFVLFKPHL